MAGLGAGLRDDGELSRRKRAQGAVGAVPLQAAASPHGREAGAGRRYRGGPRRRQWRRVRRRGRPVSACPASVISAEDEARYSGLGVVSAFPGAERYRRRPRRRQPGADRGRQSARPAGTSRFRSACSASSAGKAGEQKRTRDASTRPQGSRARQGGPRQALLHGGRLVALAGQDGHDRRPISRCRRRTIIE